MEEAILRARISDTVDICLKTNKPKFLGFLSSEQSIFAKKILEKQNVCFEFFGGFENSERVILGCFPDWCEERLFPITAITFKFRSADKLSHRDFLGTIMGLGLKRESVGDILVEETRAVAFVLKDISNYLLTQIEKVGRTGVILKEGFDLPLPQANTLSLFSVTVASLRLDCVVSALAGISRATANEKIAEGLVSVNSTVSQKNTRIVDDEDIVTIRGYGKFIIAASCDRTKKERIILKYKKYV